MNNLKKATILTCLCGLTVIAISGCGKKAAPAEPVSISVWNYYNGAQLDAFNERVAQFNDTVGKEEGIVVTGYSQGSVNDLQTNVMDAINGKVGAEEVPNIFAAYADTAYEIDQMGELVDCAPYISDELREKYIDEYLHEGDFDNSGSIKIFPIAKSTELFMLNDTDWQKFASATGATYEDFSTIEGLVDTAQKYYEWTDSLTAEPNDGKAFFGRDAMANYFLIGAMQLGNEIFSTENGHAVINLDHDVARKLWDNYYVPFVKGYFSASGRFRSDDIKIGNIIAFVGSSSSATFFPNRIVVDEEEYDIDMKAFHAPQFEGGEKYAVQQGAGMVVTKKTDAEIEASIKFLLWFTDLEQNVDFSLDSGYLPVTQEANNMELIRKYRENIDPGMEAVLEVSTSTVQENTLYTPKAFENGVEARSILENDLSTLAETDRETVKQNLESGMSLDEAAADFLSNEYFETWYQNIVKKLSNE